MSEQALRQIAHAVRYAPHMAREHNHQLVMGELADRLLAALAETPAQEDPEDALDLIVPIGKVSGKQASASGGL